MINRLRKLAKKAGHKSYKHAAIVIKGGAVQSFGYNYGKIHAEVNALKKIWPNKRAGVTVFNLRFTSKSLGNSRPCKNCLDFMVQNSVKNIWFWEDRVLKKERL